MDADQDISHPTTTTADAPARPSDDEWVLQADAARIAGCSISAVRKWRREGVVEDRLTTTIGGMERIEVRLGDVVDRASPRPGARRPVAERMAATSPGTVVIPLADLQGLFAQVGDAQQRSADAMARVTETEGEIRRLVDRLARAEAGLAKARADLEDERRRARRAGTPEPHPRHSDADQGDGHAQRTDRARAEARLTEARRELSALRRRVQELEARPVDTPDPAAAEHVVERLRAQLARAENRTTRLRDKLEQQRRRIAELEGIVLAYEEMAADEAAAAAPSSDPVEPVEPPPELPPGHGPEPRFPRSFDPPPPEDRRNGPAPRPVREPRLRPPLRPTLQRLLGPRSNGVRHPRPAAPDTALVADDLRHLYSALQNRSRSDGSDPADDGRWLADLAAYDEALVRACREFGVATDYRAGDRLPVDARVALSRALADAGLDVRARAIG